MPGLFMLPKHISCTSAGNALTRCICLRAAGLPPVESAFSLAAAEGGLSPSASGGSLVAAAAEGLLPPLEERQAGATEPQSAGASPFKPARPASRLRRASGGTASAGCSREGSQHGVTFAGAALAAATWRQAEQAAADAGVRATAARLLVANIEEAAATLPELEAPTTPRPREDSDEGSAAGHNGTTAAAAAAAPSRSAVGLSRVSSAASRPGSVGGSRTVSPEPGTAPSVPQARPFECGPAAWADLALLGGIAAAGQEFKLGMDVVEY